MTLIHQVLAADGNSKDAIISSLTNGAPSVPVGTKLAGLFSLNSLNIINLIFILVGLGFFVNLIIVGWEYMFSSGDPKKIAGASTRLINGFIGLILTVLAFVIVRLVTNVLGLGNLV